MSFRSCHALNFLGDGSVSTTAMKECSRQSRCVGAGKGHWSGSHGQCCRVNDNIHRVYTQNINKQKNMDIVRRYKKLQWINNAAFYHVVILKKNSITITTMKDGDILEAFFTEYQNAKCFECALTNNGRLGRVLKNWHHQYCGYFTHTYLGKFVSAGWCERKTYSTAH